MIFIVDDNDVSLTVAASILEDDYRLLTMTSAEKMFVLLKKFTPDFILLDIEMPDMNGFEALEIIRQTPAHKNIPVVFSSGYVDDAVLTRAKSMGALAVLVKADLPHTLAACVKKYVVPA
jgi:putative two-component system response regulator